VLGVADADARAAAEEARAVFERIDARPLLDRLATVIAVAPMAEAPGDCALTARPP